MASAASDYYVAADREDHSANTLVTKHQLMTGIRSSTLGEEIL